MPISKQIAGLEVEAQINENLKIGASGAVARGKFNRYNLVGLEGNQGPYKILGPNNEPAIVMIAGSENVYVNGVKIKRGENKDYTIDYNISEIVSIDSVESKNQFILRKGDEVYRDLVLSIGKLNSRNVHFRYIGQTRSHTHFASIEDDFVTDTDELLDRMRISLSISNFNIRNLF